MLNNQEIKVPLLIQDLGMIYPSEKSINKYKCGIYKCYCGVNFRAMTQSIKNGNTKSCGCYKSKRLKETNTTHGVSRHCIYAVWANMIKRTSNPKDIGYKYYGERGITVCDRWENVTNFIKDMYPSYQEGLTIDRINNDGNYEPSNCRWVTRSVQACNQRKIRSNNTSKYRGVCWAKHANKWLSSIRVKSKSKHIGYFNTALEAAKAYDKYVIDNNLENTMNKVL